MSAHKSRNAASAPSDNALAAALPRQGWHIQPHGWRARGGELGYKAGDHSFAVRRATCVPCYNIFLDGEMIRGKHATPAQAMDAAERRAAQMAQEGQQGHSRRRRAHDPVMATIVPYRPAGVASMSHAAEPIAIIPSYGPKDIHLGTATPAEIEEALFGLARADASTFVIAALARGLAAELTGKPDAPQEDVALLRRQADEAIERGGRLGYAFLVTAQRACAAGLPWKAIVRAGALSGADLPDGLLKPGFGDRVADYVMASLEAIIGSEAQVAYDRDHPEEAVARLLGQVVG